MFFELPNKVLMPKIGLGTYLLKEDDVEPTILEAIRVGYTHFDTAQMYDNEKEIGAALKKSMRPRSSFFITSKQQYHLSFEDAKKAFFQTLENLQTDYLDLYLVHWPNHDDQVNQKTWTFFEWLYDNHYVKAIGVCNFTRYQMDNLLKTAKIPPMVNQVELHPGLTQMPLRKYLKEKNIQVISYGPFMRGGIHEPPYNEVLNKIAKIHAVSIHQVVIAWGISQGIFMIPKTKTPNRLEENYRGSQLSLSEEEIQTINALNRGKRVYSDPSNNPHGILVS